MRLLFFLARGRTINNGILQQENQIDLLDEAQIHLRDNFPQSWMWFDLETRFIYPIIFFQVHGKYLEILNE